MAYNVIKNCFGEFPEFLIYFACLSLGLDFEKLKRTALSKKITKQLRARCLQLRANETLLLDTIKQYGTPEKIAEYLNVEV
jgi:serine/threonine protein kinase HipA of HipAB toxin-antitoxin module